MSSPISINVIPASPGFATLIDLEDEREVVVGESVIAFRIETYREAMGESVYSVCVPLTVDGDAVSNCIGVQNPDKTVTVFESASYETLEALQVSRYPA
jgi:hypothetical protein